MIRLASILLPILLGSTPQYQPDEYHLIFAGDAMMHQAQLDASSISGDLYDYSSCFAAIADEIKGADYAVVNLETPLSAPPYSGYPCFNAPASYAKALSDAGFDLLLTSNNHTLDRRDTGIGRTITALDSLGIAHIGTYRNETERSNAIPDIQTIGDIKVGFLNYTYGTNGFVEHAPTIVDRIDRRVMSTDIKATRAAGAELIAVCIHWGDEYQLLPNADQKATALWLAEQGVEMIIGGHPHVIQPMELHKNNNGHNTLIVYSLGNLISNMRTTDTRGGAMVRVSIGRDPDGQARVREAAYRLVMVEPGSSGQPFKVTPADADSTMSVTTRLHRDHFRNNAYHIFNTHNINVGEDSIRLSGRDQPRLKALTPIPQRRQTAAEILHPLPPARLKTSRNTKTATF